MFPDAIETERLRFERFSRETVDPLELYEYTPDHSKTIEAEVAYVSWDAHETPKETLEMVERAEEKWDDREAATYVVYPRPDETGAGEFAGTTSLFFEWDKRLAYTGIWLRKPFWGRGYAGERATAAFSLAFDRLDLEVVVPAHLDGNEKSRRAIERYVDRFGGRYEGLLRNEIVVDDEPRDLHRYSVSRTEWRENRPDDLDVSFFDGASDENVPTRSAMSSIFPERFETDRLRFEPFTTATIDPLELYEHTHAGSGFADLMAHLSVDAHETPYDAREYLLESESEWEEATRANWAMFPRPGEPDGGEFAGVASLIPLWERRTARLGVWLLKPFWGRGYAGERAAALIELAFDYLDFELVAAGHLEGNDNSRRAIEKYVDRSDGQYEGVIRNCVALDGEVHDLHRYTITPEAWAENRPAGGIRILDDGTEDEGDTKPTPNSDEM